MANFQTFNLGDVLSTAEAIKGARQQSKLDELREISTRQQIDIQGQQAKHLQTQFTEQQRLANTQWLANATDQVLAITDPAQQMETLKTLGEEGKRRGILAPNADLSGVDMAKLAQLNRNAKLSLGSAPQQETIRDESGAVLQRDPTTGALKQVVAPQKQSQEPEAVRTLRAMQADPSLLDTDRARDKRTTQQPPSGYQWAADGKTLEPVRGGPADMTGPGAKKQAAPLRKEFRSLTSVKDYETVLPLIKSAEKAPDTGYGDLQLIYTAGKILDPGSVVRESELALTIASGTPLQRVLGATRFSLEKGGRLTPETRKQITEMLNERVGAYEQAYQRDFQQYSEYATDTGLDPVMIVGKSAESAYATKGTTKAPAPGAAVEYLKTNPQFKDAFRQKYGYLPDGL